MKRPLATYIGVGQTNYGADWRRRDVVRSGEDMAKEALNAALEDCGLAASDIDGVTAPRAPGGLIASESLMAELGLSPKWMMPHGSADPLDAAVIALETGQATTIAIVYATAQRSVNLQYGGPNSGSLYYPSYYYYNPWGFSSQGAHWAMLFKRYQELYGATEEQLGSVAVMQRANAILNPCAVMTKPLSIEDYLATRYVCRPLRLLDYCMVNDGAVVLILTTAARAKGSRQPAVDVLGRATQQVSLNEASQLRPLVLDMQQTLLKATTADCFGQAGVTQADIDHFQCYDAFSINLPVSLEGVGFCKPGEGLRFIVDGRAAIGAELPCNTSGGMLSEGYMHSWNHMAEAIRQLRGHAGPRQVKDAEFSCFSFFDSELANVTVMQRAS